MNDNTDVYIFSVDKEELRADKDVEITFKELIDLFEFTDTFFKQEEQEVSKKRKLSDNLDIPVEKNTLVKIWCCYKFDIIQNNLTFWLNY